MKKTYLFLWFTLLAILSCKQKKSQPEKEESFFPVLSFIKSQIAHVDTSFYEIKKIVWSDSVHTDTIYEKREDFAALAKDFLEIPDLSEKKYSSIYTEEKFFDQGLNKVILTCKPKNADTVIIQRQETLIQPDQVAGDKVVSFIIDTYISNKDSSIQKKLLWQVDKSFQVVTTVQKPAGEETNSIIKVLWGDEKDNE